MSENLNSESFMDSEASSMDQNSYAAPASSTPAKSFIPPTAPTSASIPYTQVPPTQPAPIVVPARGGWAVPFFSGCTLGCSGCLVPFMLFLIFCAVLGMSLETSLTRTVLSGPSDAFPSSNAAGAADPSILKIAVIEICETIMENDGFIADQIDDVFEDPSIKGIVLRMDTPGGAVSTSDLFYHRLTKLRKERNIPIVVSMGGVCASGGYYIAMACGTENEDVLFAEPTTWTGSIGVIINSYDFSELAEKVGIKEDPIKSHELKGMGSMTRPMTEKERAIFQSLVDSAFKRFKEVIYSGRKQFADSPDQLTPLATGEVFTTEEALKNGLVDREGYLEDAIDRVLELTGHSKDSVQIFKYGPKQTLSDLMSAAQKKLVRSQADEVREMMVPRASYLWQAGN